MYPRLLIDSNLAEKNASVVRQICLDNNIRPMAVIKGFNALPALVDAIIAAGYTRFGSSRIAHLRALKERGLDVETAALRIPMLSEVEELVRWCDISLESEIETLREVDREASRQGITHKVILMRDLGDLREGIVSPEEFYTLAETVEHKLPHLYLEGVGTNMTCYGSMIPTPENTGELVQDAREIERRIGRRLNTVSGGASSALALAIGKTIPAGITELRIGNALILPNDLSPYIDSIPSGLSNRILRLQAEIIEFGEKPTMPRGPIGVDGFGSQRHYEDRGIRRRALLALGQLDVGDCKKLIPIDSGAQILGASSDHMIVDIQDSKCDYHLGGIMEFELTYQSMMHATLSDLIEKVVVR